MRSVSSTDFNTWAGNPTPEEYNATLARMKKKTLMWCLLALIPFAGNFVLSGFAVFALNNYQAYKTKSLTRSLLWVTLLRFFFMLWGGIIFPIIIVNLLAGKNKLSSSLAGKITGMY